MSKAIYWGGGTSRKVKRIYLGIDGVSHKVKKGYIGDETGKARLFYSSGRVWKKYNTTSTRTYYWDRFNISTIYTWNQYAVQYQAQHHSENNGTHEVFKTYSNGLNYYFLSGTDYYISNNKLYVSGSKVYTERGWVSGTTITSASRGFENGHKYAYHNSTGSNSGTTRLYEIDNDSYWSWRRVQSATEGVATYVQWRIHGTIGYLTVTEGPGGLQGTVTSESSSAYPNNGKSNNKWYIYSGSSQGKGSTQYSDVSSSNRSAYPDNGVSGNYWYEYDRSSVSYSRGSYISDVEADPGTYPSNGRHTDGYWYVLQPE